MKIIYLLLALPILFIPLPGMTDGLFTSLWDSAPGYMTLACVLTAVGYFFFKFNHIVLRMGILEKDMKALEKKMDDGFEGMEKRMDRMDARFERLEDKLERLEDKISTIMEFIMRKG